MYIRFAINKLKKKIVTTTLYTYITSINVICNYYSINVVFGGLLPDFTCEVNTL